VVPRSFYVGAIMAVSVGLPGCEHDPLQKVQVHGKVTFDGGACPGPGRVTFSPMEVPEGLPMRPGSGSFAADGAYQAMSFRPGDGLVPGKYQVGVACFDPSKLSGAPSDAEFRDASYVSEDFSPPELVVEPGSGVLEFNLDVPKR
jgi:hypothetical protein